MRGKASGKRAPLVLQRGEKLGDFFRLAFRQLMAFNNFLQALSPICRRQSGFIQVLYRQSLNHGLDVLNIAMRDFQGIGARFFRLPAIVQMPF